MKPAKTRVGAARRVALDVLRRVEAEGAFASLAIDHALQRHVTLSREDRALVTQLVYGTLRWRRRIDYALAAYSSRPLERIEPNLLRILRMTAYQLLFLERVPDYAAVDQGTELAVVMRGKRAGGFVNGVARGLARSKDQIEWPQREENLVRHLAVQHSYPGWMVRWLIDLLGTERAEAFMAAANQPAPLWVRINPLRGTVAGLVELLSASGFSAGALKSVPGAIEVAGVHDLRSLAAHEAGLFHVQDAAAQAVCLMLDPKPGERILDACAAPGGKTATLAQLMGDEGEVLAIDQHPARLGLVRQLADRLGLRIVDRSVGDLVEQIDQIGSFDRVLLDAPCTALGVLRKHPEGKWRIQAVDMPRMAEVQRELLNAAARVVKPGGHLVYSVCTVSEEEGPGQVRSWLAEQAGQFELVDPRQEKRAPWHKLVSGDGFLRTWPDRDNMDGFFAARLRRVAT